MEKVSERTERLENESTAQSVSEMSGDNIEVLTEKEISKENKKSTISSLFIMIIGIFCPIIIVGIAYLLNTYLLLDKKFCIIISIFLLVLSDMALIMRRSAKERGRK